MTPGAAPPGAEVTLLPDAGPLITLAYGDALDLLFKPGWPVWLVDMALDEVTRNETPTSAKLAAWAAGSGARIIPTRTLASHRLARVAGVPPSKNNLGELAIQEVMSEFALATPEKTGVFLFEDHKIARASFFVPANCRKVSARAYLLFLEAKGWIDSAAKIERRAIAAGRSFSKIRFPPG